MKNWQQEIRKNQKLTVYSIITFCLLVANYTLFFKPTIASLRKTMPQLGTLQRQVMVAQTAAINIPRYGMQIADLKSKLSLHKKKFSTKQEISSLLKGLSEMAKDSGVKIISITPHSAITSSEQGLVAGGYQKFPISIKASCGYHQLGAFLNELENADTFMRVTDISIRGNAQKPVEHMVYILVNTYVIHEAA